MLNKIFNRHKTDMKNYFFDNKLTIIRKPIKHLYLRVHIDGNIVVSAPMTMPMKTIQSFIDSKKTWIENKQRQQAQRKQLLYTDNPTDNPTDTALNNSTDKPTQLVLFGQHYPLVYRSGQGINHNHLVLQGQGAIISLRKNSTGLSVANTINTFYRQQLQTELNALVYRYQSVIGVRVSEIRIKQMKTKWGTCNIPNKRLWFNLQLAKLPIKCSEYVVVHEMTHLLERYHNRRFYQLVETAMPDWEVWHRYLKKL